MTCLVNRWCNKNLTMKSLRATVTLLLLLAPVVLLAQRSTTVRLGTILPANSVWDKALKKMGLNGSRRRMGAVVCASSPGLSGGRIDESSAGCELN